MKTIGSFKIESSHHITNRGIAVVGQEVEGYPKLGKYLLVDICGKKQPYRIIGIECGRPNENMIIRYGLLLSIDDPELVRYIASNKISEQVASILENE